MADKQQPKTGDIVKLKQHLDSGGGVGLIIEVEKSEMFGDGGWTTFNYVILTPAGHIMNISEATIEKILS
jgi:hypothetical protein